MGVESLELRVSGEFSVESLEIVVKLFSWDLRHGTETRVRETRVSM